MPDKGVKDTLRNTSDDMGHGKEVLLSEAELDHLLNAAPTARASNTLQRLILDDFDAIQKKKNSHNTSNHFAEALNDIFRGTSPRAFRVPIESDRGSKSLFGRTSFADNRSDLSAKRSRTSSVASIVSLVRLVPMATFSVCAVVGFLIGNQISELPSQHGEAYARADAEVFEYFSTTLVETAYFDDGDSLWRVE